MVGRSQAGAPQLSAWHEHGRRRLASAAATARRANAPALRVSACGCSAPLAAAHLESTPISGRGTCGYTGSSTVVRDAGSARTLHRHAFGLDPTPSWWPIPRFARRGGRMSDGPVHRSAASLAAVICRSAAAFGRGVATGRQTAPASPSRRARGVSASASYSGQRRRFDRPRWRCARTRLCDRAELSATAAGEVRASGRRAIGSLSRHRHVAPAPRSSS